MNDEIQVQIDDTINKIPIAIKGKITKVYDDNHVDIETEIGEIIYSPVIANNPQIGHFALAIPVSETDYVIISK